MRTKKYTPVFVSEIPLNLEEGYLYVAIKYNAIVHLCPCGCRSEISTPLHRTKGWQMKYDGDKISLSPSIGNYAYPCRSHYFINDNKVIWVNETDTHCENEMTSGNGKKKSFSLLESLKKRLRFMGKKQ